MKFVSSRDFRLKPGEIWELLASGEDLVVTSHGKPLAVLIGTSEDTMHLMLQEISRLKAKLAVTSMRLKAQERGLDKLPESEIDEIVKDVRDSRP